MNNTLGLQSPSVTGLANYVPPKGLRVIRPRHALMLRDYMSGMSRKMVAMKYQVTPQTVTNLVNDPSVRERISAGVEHSLNDLDTLLPSAVEAVGDVLRSGSAREKLAAADKVFRAKNLYGGREQPGATADEVMQRIVQQFKDTGAVFTGPTVVQISNERSEQGR